MLQQAQADGELVPDLDTSCEAARLVAINHGLGTTVLIGQRTAEEAMAVLRYHLDRLFGSREQATAPPENSQASPSHPG